MVRDAAVSRSRVRYRKNRKLACCEGVAQIDGVDLTPEMLAQAGMRKVYRRLQEASVEYTGLPGARKRTFLSFLGTETGDELTQRSAWAAAPMIGACPDG